MALQQLNLKLPPEVAAHWSAQARAEGLSVRDWLISRVGPAAGPAPAAAGAELLERVAALEAGLAELRAAARVNPAPRSAERVEPLRVPLGPGHLEIIGANHLRPPAEPFASPDRVNPAAAAGDALPLRRLTPAEAAGLLTTPEVGEALGLALGRSVVRGNRCRVSDRSLLGAPTRMGRGACLACPCCNFAERRRSGLPFWEILGTNRSGKYHSHTFIGRCGPSDIWPMSLSGNHLH